VTNGDQNVIQVVVVALAAHPETESTWVSQGPPQVPLRQPLMLYTVWPRLAAQSAAGIRMPEPSQPQTLGR
jgi:hypothetical protein